LRDDVDPFDLQADELEDVPPGLHARNEVAIVVRAEAEAQVDTITDRNGVCGG